VAPEPAVVLFDGICNLCNGLVRFVIRRDRARRFRFAALQSETGHRLVQASGLDEGGGDSIVLIQGRRVYQKSCAVLRIARGLQFPWPAAYALMAAPRPLRDWVYDLVARHRYRWFGRRTSCVVPAPELRDRFLG
jgi:predicted DCC family thiol-disulfide oxidoreductase YuxK